MNLLNLEMYLIMKNNPYETYIFSPTELPLYNQQ